MGILLSTMSTRVAVEKTNGQAAQAALDVRVDHTTWTSKPKTAMWWFMVELQEVEKTRVPCGLHKNSLNTPAFACSRIPIWCYMMVRIKHSGLQAPMRKAVKPLLCDGPKQAQDHSFA